MATKMTIDELEKARAMAVEVETFDFRDAADEDNYVLAALYKAKNGRLFRFISASGMNSHFDGAGNIGEWLSTNERASWRSF